MALQHLRSSTANKRPTPAGMSDGQLALNTNLASPGLFFKDSNGALVKVGPVHVGTTAPNASPGAGGQAGNSVGEQWLDTSGTNPVFKIWNGSAWISEAGEFINASGDVMTGALGIIAGAVGTPGLYFSGDPDTGLYSPGADQVAISTNGSQRATIDSSGRLLVGDSVSQTVVEAHTAQVSHAAGLSASFVRYATAGVASSVISLGRSKSATIGTQEIVVNGDALGQIRFVGSDGALYRRAAEITSSIDGTPASDSMPGRLTFSTTPSSSITPTERMRLTAAGNLGIGLTAPNELLEVAGNIHVSGADRSIFNRSNNALAFGTNNTERARIDSSGRLLVGTNASRQSRLSGSAYTAILQVEADTTINGQSFSRFNDSTAANILSLQRGRGTIASPSIVLANDNLGLLNFSGWDGTTWSNAAWIQAVVDGTPGANDMPGRLLFATTPAGSNISVERMRLNSAGNLLIGNTTGTDTLSVTGTASVSTSITTNNAYNDGTVSKDTKTDGMVIGGGIDLPGTTTNLHLRSQDFSTGWVSANANATLSVDSGVVAPDGTTGVGKFVCADTTSVSRRLYASADRVTVSGTEYTYSVYLKSINGWTDAWVETSGGTGLGGQARYLFNLSTGTYTRTQGANASIANVGNGWWRVSVTTLNNTVTNMRPKIILAVNPVGAVGIVDAGVYVWGAQLTPVPSGQTTALGPYIRTEGTAVTDAAGYIKINGITRISSNGDITATSINSGPLAGFRNAIINGNFDHWQRGTSFSNPSFGTYLADRWFISLDGTGATRTISRQAFTVGQTDVPGEPTYFLRFNQSVAGTGGTGNDIVQRIEGVRTFAGQQVTFSFWAKAAASLTLPSVSIGQIFGTGGSPSAQVFTTAALNVSVTTAWQKFSYTVTLPSISGKTLGTDGNDSLAALIRAPLNATFTLDIAQVQVEPGPVATTFERRPIGTELALCQRYYNKSYNLDIAPGTVTNSGYFLSFAANGFTLHQGNLRFPVPMRGVPSATLYSPITGASGVVRDVVANADRVTVLTNIGQNGGEVNSNNLFVVTTNYYTFHYTASAEL